MGLHCWLGVTNAAIFELDVVVVAGGNSEAIKNQQQCSPLKMFKNTLFQDIHLVNHFLKDKIL